MLTKMPAIHQLKNHAPVATGLLIGAGGLNEWTGVGIATWLILYLQKTWQQSWPKLYWQDAIIIAISILWICYSAYNDLLQSSDDTGLTANEGIKIMFWSLFGLSMTRCSRNNFFGTINGIAIGIGLFALATTIGALSAQPLQGSRGLIYNIFTGDIGAGSTYVAYACVASTLLLILTNNKLAWMGSITCVTLGIQAINRHSLVVGIATLIFLAINEFQWVLAGRRTKKELLPIQIIGIIVVLLSIWIYHSLDLNELSIRAIHRLQDFSGSDARINIYATGYDLLGKSIRDNNFELLQDVNKAVTRGNPNWWHSLPLDSARAFGWLGLLLSVVWLGGIAKGMVNSSRRRSDYIFVGLLTLVTLLTSIPLGLGGYELLGSLTLTQAILSSDKA